MRKVPVFDGDWFDEDTRPAKNTSQCRLASGPICLSITMQLRVTNELGVAGGFDASSAEVSRIILGGQVRHAGIRRDRDRDL